MLSVDVCVFLLMVLHQVQEGHRSGRNFFRGYVGTRARGWQFLLGLRGAHLFSQMAFFLCLVGKITLAECPYNILLKPYFNCEIGMHAKCIKPGNSLENYYKVGHPVATTNIEHCRFLRYLLPLRTPHTPHSYPWGLPSLKQTTFNWKAFEFWSTWLSHMGGACLVVSSGDWLGLTTPPPHTHPPHPVHHCLLVLDLQAGCRSVFLLLHCPLVALMT